MAPASVRILAQRLQFLPEIWGQCDDFILLADNTIMSARSNFTKFEPDKITSVEPWGWDKALSHRLSGIGIPDRLLPSHCFLENLRRLSHRRISIKCNSFLKAPYVPKECFSVEEAMSFFEETSFCYFKMPWSSGGRGVVSTLELNYSQVKEWVGGCIRRQGSVLAEKGVDRWFDFSSLWNVSERNVTFEGFSISLSDGRGKYVGNLYGPQPEIEKFIKDRTPGLDDSVLYLLKKFIIQTISPFYNGKLGVDMMVAKDSGLYPCVEINLRRTMGHVALDFFNLLEYEKNSDSWKRQCRKPPLFSLEKYLEGDGIDRFKDFNRNSQ